jgi:hypothetical protein
VFGVCDEQIRVFLQVFRDGEFLLGRYTNRACDWLAIMDFTWFCLFMIFVDLVLCGSTSVINDYQFCSFIQGFFVNVLSIVKNVAVICVMWFLFLVCRLFFVFSVS